MHQPQKKTTIKTKEKPLRYPFHTSIARKRKCQTSRSTLKYRPSQRPPKFLTSLQSARMKAPPPPLTINQECDRWSASPPHHDPSYFIIAGYGDAPERGGSVINGYGTPLICESGESRNSLPFLEHRGMSL
ncbi:hypothetical protein CEXT_345101 [Caerostris extrusa]|uniref:Uncharacterized protein n=1 Tax=Caerostris extrusa TaxID=172846 RepID=A0AAV4TIX6_CAEEX|nr:hypothetical protein CEXT_345101 [Caerostris extrusa]